MAVVALHFDGAARFDDARFHDLVAAYGVGEAVFGSVGEGFPDGPAGGVVFVAGGGAQGVGYLGEVILAFAKEGGWKGRAHSLVSVAQTCGAINTSSRHKAA